MSVFKHTHAKWRKPPGDISHLSVLLHTTKTQKQNNSGILAGNFTGHWYIIKCLLKRVCCIQINTVFVFLTGFKMEGGKILVITKHK